MSNRMDKERSWDQALRERVQGVEISPSKRIWGDIERSLIAQEVSSSSRSHLWRWLGGAVAGVAAAAAIALLLIDTPSMEEELLHAVEESYLTATTSSNIPQTVTPTSALTPTSTPIPTSTSTILDVNSDEEESTLVDIVNIGDEDQDQDQKGVVTDQQGGVKASKRSTNGRGYSQNSYYPEVAESYHNTNKDGRKVTLSMLGSGGLIAQSSSVPGVKPVRATAYDVLVDPVSYDGGSDNPYPYYEDVSHHQPFSFGLRVQYALIPRLRLVSGLNYTRLTSDFKLGSGGSIIEDQQQIHFVGVPLRLDYQFVKLNDFALYAGAGGMIEYCVGAELGGRKIDEKPWHASLNVALGAEYQINRWLGLYFEPDVSYYLTKTKLKSIRNDSPTTFTLRLGVSFSI